MNDIISQGIPQLVGTGAIAGLAIWIVQRQLRRAVIHVDDVTKHLNSNNSYVRESLCEQRWGELKRQGDEQKRDIVRIHQRLDKLIESHQEQTERILRAVQDGRTT